ncbi:hypothetical protein CRE_18763 [Caenorhabditis remanei]|uniref:Uncharacterized protein n=1 Tax=Caenorhabditis remanei TaxID=31234 RepID=E3LK35_CAERE|nr:hypothetical protein CRE_18763 [Caenorhabditis remanei]
MSDTNGVSDDPMETGTSSVDSVKDEGNDKDSNTEQMEVDEGEKALSVDTEVAMETATLETSEEKQEDPEENVEMDKKDDESEEKADVIVKTEDNDVLTADDTPQKEVLDAEKKGDGVKPDKKEDVKEEEGSKDGEVKEEDEEKEKDTVAEEKQKTEKDLDKNQEKKESDQEKTPSPKKEAKEEKESKKKDAEQTNGHIKRKSDKQSPKKREKSDGKENSSGSKLTNREHILDHIEIKRDASNRVKLYVLCDQRIWEDRGTGHVVTYQVTAEDGSPSNAGQTMVLVRLEGQNKNILESRIMLDTVYQKQQVRFCNSDW